MAVGWLMEGVDVMGGVLQRTSSVSWQTVVSLCCICLNRVSSSVLSSCSVLNSHTWEPPGSRRLRVQRNKDKDSRNVHLGLLCFGQIHEHLSDLPYLEYFLQRGFLPALYYSEADGIWFVCAQSSRNNSKANNSFELQLALL